MSNLTELYFYIKLPPKIKKYKKEKNKNNFTLQFQGRCDDDDDGDDDDDFFKNCWYRNFVQTRFQDPVRLDQMLFRELYRGVSVGLNCETLLQKKFPFFIMFYAL